MPTISNEKTLEKKEPAKGGTAGAKPNVHPVGDSPKPHGDPFKHEQAKKQDA
jgi:hypothetical protein